MEKNYDALFALLDPYPEKTKFDVKFDDKDEIKRFILSYSPNIKQEKESKYFKILRKYKIISIKDPIGQILSISVIGGKYSVKNKDGINTNFEVINIY